MATIKRVKRIGDLEATLIVTSNQITLRQTILVTLMMEQSVLPKRRSLKDPHAVTSQKTAFLTVPAAKT
jgi:hypothetical protein